MLEMKKGVDILSDVGGLKTIDEARKVFEANLDSANLAKISKIKNEEALLKIANAISMCEPDNVFIISDTREDAAYVKQRSIETGEEKKLAIKDHTIHFDFPEDQGRLVSQTFYIINEDEDISALAKKQLRSEAHQYVKDNMKGIMKGLPEPGTRRCQSLHSRPDDYLLHLCSDQRRPAVPERILQLRQ